MDGACLLIEADRIDAREHTPHVTRPMRAPAVRRPLSPVCDHVVGDAVAVSVWQRPWAHTGIPLTCSVLIHATILMIGLLGYRITPTSRAGVLVDLPVTLAEGAAGSEMLPTPLLDVTEPQDATAAVYEYDLKVPRDPRIIEPTVAQKLTSAVPALADAEPLMLGIGGASLSGAAGSESSNAAPALRVDPPNRTEFFGVTGNAKTVVFVCDASGSMLGTNDVITTEVQRSILALHPSQRFNLIFISGKTPRFFTQSSLPAADAGNKLAACEFAKNIQSRGRTLALPAIVAALEQKPDIMYIISDGDFEDRDAVMSAVRRMNSDNATRINVIVISGAIQNADPASFASLKQLAMESGGTCRVINPNATESPTN